MGGHGLHRWGYGCLERAGVVAKGQSSSERMHKARHTAGERVLDATHGNLKAVQKVLGHSSISTTGDIYTDWDIDQLAETLRSILEEGESDSFPPGVPRSHQASGLCAWQESNLRPCAPEAHALSPELQARGGLVYPR